MSKLNKPPLLLFFGISFFYMFPRIVTSIADAMHFELPVRLTLIILFPIMAFFTPAIAIIYGKHVKNIKLAFASCFFPVVIWEFVYSIVIGIILYISSLEIIRILILSFSLGLIGASRGFAKERAEYKVKYGLMALGIALWFIIFGEGIIRWFRILMGIPIPD
ncbi:MAG: hypothetical protein M5U10_10075 [Candidatus Methanoperedens sp.]|uniref:hypothetical protein n=1 Tax=Candidatus Methanoperedens nitratireducens TaxID=1392998 RepID=UPI0012FEC8A4|nr:hypothetical protein [Candidatus Methanoperedens nitroreducens]MDJ1422249.1 hypothetical protein [Candidatus Methanoperedens sp.]